MHVVTGAPCVALGAACAASTCAGACCHGEGHATRGTGTRITHGGARRGRARATRPRRRPQGWLRPATGWLTARAGPRIRQTVSPGLRTARDGGSSTPPPRPRQRGPLSGPFSDRRAVPPTEVVGVDRAIRSRRSRSAGRWCQSGGARRADGHPSPLASRVAHPTIRRRLALSARSARVAGAVRPRSCGSPRRACDSRPSTLCISRLSPLASHTFDSPRPAPPPASRL